MIEVLGLAGSPRKGGNSDLLLDAFLQGTQKAGAVPEKIYLNDLHIRPCQACDGCAQTGYCVLRDDLQELYPKVAACSGLVLATPITFGSLSAQVKTFIDRFECWWYAKYRLKKPFISAVEKRPAFFISVGALPRKSFYATAEAVAKVFFHSTNFHLQGSLRYMGFDTKGSIAVCRTALQETEEAGHNFAIGIKNGLESVTG